MDHAYSFFLYDLSVPGEQVANVDMVVFDVIVYLCAREWEQFEDRRISSLQDAKAVVNGHTVKRMTVTLS